MGVAAHKVRRAAELIDRHERLNETLRALSSEANLKSLQITCIDVLREEGVGNFMSLEIADFTSHLNIHREVIGAAVVAAVGSVVADEMKSIRNILTVDGIDPPSSHPWPPLPGKRAPKNA